MNNTLLASIIGIVIVLGIGGFVFMGSSNSEKNTITDAIEMCAQVITPARNPATGEIKEFPTPCDVPDGWEVATMPDILDEEVITVPSPVPSTSANPETSPATPPGLTAPPQSQNVAVAYTDEGFSPKSVTVKNGMTATFTNNSSHRMWVGAAMHPTHEAYDGTTTSEHCANGVATNGTFDQCHAVDAGGSWSYTFNKVGSWNYHNHSRATNFGTVVVTP